MSEIGIRVEGLGKQYRIGAQRERYKTLRDTIAGAACWPARAARSMFSRNGRGSSEENTFWALKNVSFEVKRGELVGVIGRNGAGKTTLLKLLSRITEPTEGRAEVYGRVGSLLEVGTGFHPELTGRENIYLNGAILGMRKTQIDLKFDEIVAFAEVEKFLDTMVKHYSSGMYLRLAFAVAAHLEPDILLVDEILAVGDAAFQKKCLGKMDEVAVRGRTVFFVSHNMASISRLCSRALLLDCGRLAAVGPPTRTIEQYLSQVRSLSVSTLENRTDRQGSGAVRLTHFEVTHEHGATSNVLFCGQSAMFRLRYEATHRATLSNVVFSFAIYSIYGQHLVYCDNEMAGTHFQKLPACGSVSCRIPRFPLTPGSYSVTVHCSVNGVDADWVPDVTRVIVESADFFGSGRLPPTTHGGFLVDQAWLLEF